jgi:hypothetical protein
MVSQRALQLPEEDLEPLHHQHPPLAPEALLEAEEEAEAEAKERLWNPTVNLASHKLRQIRSVL